VRNFVVLFPVSIVAEYYFEYACVIGFIWNESGMFGLMYDLELLDGGIVAWELDVWDKGGGYGMRNMKWCEIGIIPWVSWGVSWWCVVYILR